MVDSRSEAIWARTLGYLETALADVRVVEADCVTQEEAAGYLSGERTPMECRSVGGVCSICYGPEPGTSSFPPTGAPVGQWAAAALRHPGRAPERRAPSFHLGEWPHKLVAGSTGTIRVEVPEGLALEQGSDKYLDSPFCLVVRDPGGNGAAVRVQIGEQANPLLLYEESRLLVFPGDAVMAGQNVAYRRPFWERPFRGYLRQLADCLEVRSRPPRAYLCQVRGVLRVREALDGTKKVYVEEESLGAAGRPKGSPELTGRARRRAASRSRFFCGRFPADRLEPDTRDGAWVAAGDQLTGGNVWHRDRLNTLGVDETARCLIDQLTFSLEINRMAVDPRVIRLVVARMLCYLRIDEIPPHSPWRVGQVEDAWVTVRSFVESEAREGVLRRRLVLGARVMARVARAIRADGVTSGNSVP